MICSECRVILKTGDQFTEEEIAAIKGHEMLPAQYCLKCQLINALNDNGIEWTEKIMTRNDEKYRVVSFKPPFPESVRDIIGHKDVITYGYLTTQYEPGIDVYFKM